MRTLARVTLVAGLLCLGLMSGPALAAPLAAASNLKAARASPEARAIAGWIVASGDNHAEPFVIIDKAAARVFVFHSDGSLRGAAPALLGLAHGDDSVPGIGERALATIRPEERTTPAGRFVASLGADLGIKDVLWVDYANAISLHRVITTKPKERRLQRLASPTIADNRISYGCINVPAKFYDTVVGPSFLNSSGIVYILPEVRSLASVFPGYGVATDTH